MFILFLSALIFVCSSVPVNIYATDEPEQELEDFQDHFASEDLVYEYQTQAYDILHIFQDHTWVPAQHVRSLELIINRLNNNPSPHTLKPIHQVLRCYQALAFLCTEKKTITAQPSKKQRAMLTLLARRAEVITKIGHAAYPAALAALINYNLAAYLHHEPTPEEVAYYQEQEKMLIEKRNAALNTLNQELFEIEKQILKDPQSKFVRYATPLMTIIGAAALFVGVVRGIDAIRARSATTHNKRTLIV
jgi:hypothetical protein